MNCSFCSHAEVFLPIANLEPALHASYDRSGKTAGDESHGDVPISAWEAALNEETILISAGVAAMVNSEAPCEVDHRPIENHRNEKDDIIAR